MPGRVSFAVWSVSLVTLALAGSTAAIGHQVGRRGGPPPPRAAGPPPNQPTAVILGRVIDGDSGAPIGGAIVQLSSPGAPTPVTPDAESGLSAAAPREQHFVIADSQGRFVFRDVRPGSHPLSARLTGYLPAQHGQRRPAGPGESLLVSANQPVTETVIRMWRYASVSGVVRDEAGEPAVGVSVRVLRRTFAGGRERLQALGSATTDDRGVYRLANLTPGRYYVFVPSTTTSVATSTAEWYLEARAEAGSSTEVLQSFRESRAPTPSATGLRVGDHVVAVSSLRSSTAPSVTSDGRLEIYRTIFHPSATTIEQATAITVAAGEEREGADIRLMLEPAYQITGEVRAADGPAQHIGVRLLAADTEAYASDLGLETSVTSTDLEGRFTLLGVPPGQYTIEVLRVPRPAVATRMTTMISSGSGGVMMSSIGPGDTPPAASDAPTLWAEQAVAVGEGNVSGVALQLREGARVQGRLVFEGAAPPPPPETLERVSITLQPSDGQRLAAITTPARARADATFETGGYPPGLYDLNAGAAAAPGVLWRLKSAMHGGRDLLDQPLAITGENITGVVLTFTDTSSSLSGTVQFPPDSEDDALVAIFPVDYRAWIDGGMSSRRARTVGTNTQGRFTVSGLRPGAYLGVAVPPDTEVDLQDPASVSLLARLATPIQIPETGSSSVTLRLTPVR